jgi:ABC-type antimicrobial peptide transport system permease subunit
MYTSLCGRGGAVAILVARQCVVLIFLTLTGATVGGLAAAALARFISSLLHGVGTFDPVTYGAVLALLAGVGIMASGVPAWRATRVDPLITLRSE